ncbi:MAG: serine/threonine protein kinase [Blastocatellia bacterium]|nr:serine/threonine protein kinase [Blastocatellia bacterium]
MATHCPVCKREFSDDATFCTFDGQRLIAEQDNKMSQQNQTNQTKKDRFLGITIDGKYLVEEMVGQGGMGNVYKAKHLQMDSTVAIKILHPHLISDQTSVERFRREARAARTVNHPNAIQVLDFGVSSDNTVYLVMEFLEGLSLRKVIDLEKPMPADRVVKIMRQACDALDAAHNQNIIHRDLKPDNIIITGYKAPTELVKVLDFSIAKLRMGEKGGDLTQAGMVVGTPQYMSPEQAEGKELDSRSDLYSLGVMLYEMLTGQLPFKAATPVALVLKHIHAAPRPPRELVETLPQSIESVVLKALAKKREERQQSVLDLAAELEQALTVKDLPVTPPISGATTLESPRPPASTQTETKSTVNTTPTTVPKPPVKVDVPIVQNTESENQPSSSNLIYIGAAVALVALLVVVYLLFFR